MTEVSDHDDAARTAFLHASLILGFCAFEAHINAVAEEMLLRPELTAHERGLLSERKVNLTRGRFELFDGLQMVRIEDRLQFLWTRFSSDKAFDTNDVSWGQFKSGLELRNGLTHPKNAMQLDIERVKRTLIALITLIDTLYRRVYKKPFPMMGKGLNSTLNF